MDDPLILTWLSVVILFLSALFIGAFAREPWWRSQFGQSVMILAVAVLLFSLIAVMRQVLGPDYAGRVWLIGVTRSLVIIAMAQRLYVLIRARRNDRD